MRRGYHSYVSASPISNIITGIIHMLLWGSAFIFILCGQIFRHGSNWFDFILFELMFAFLFYVGVGILVCGIDKLLDRKKEQAEKNNEGVEDTP